MTNKTKAAKPPKANAFSAAADVLGGIPAGGLDALFGAAAAGDQYSQLPVDDIEVRDQIRETFDGEDSALTELAASIKALGIVQPLLVRPVASGKYHLVAGERRLRAARLAGLEAVPVIIREMSDAQADDAQLAENIHRLNLTQIEQARKLKRDLDDLGTLEALAAKHGKSVGWLSKVLSVLDLPPQAARLISENVSADLAVIGDVRQVEKADPAAAAQLVDKLQAGRGKLNARELAKETKERVAPKKPRAEKATPAAEKGDSVATSRDRSVEEPGPVKLIDAEDDDWNDFLQHSSAVEQTQPASDPLDTLWRALQSSKASAADVLAAQAPGTVDEVEAEMRTIYDAGKQSKNLSQDVLTGLRSGGFATQGPGAFRLSAFLLGADSDARYSLANIVGGARL
jgi:ParB family chromosome partitioning protein